MARLVSFDKADVIYVNAGCTAPAESWLDGLADGGRLILPMTSDRGLAPRRRSEWPVPAPCFVSSAAARIIFATWISRVAIFPCAGSRDEVSERALAEAFAKGGWQKVTRLYRGEEIPEERCWVRGPGWCLAYD